MHHISFQSFFSTMASRTNILIFILVLGNLIFTVVANASFRVSAHSAHWRIFLVWQVIGNLAGLVTVITLTWLLRYQPLSLAFPLTTGLGVIGVQIFASRWLFGESISLERWLGSILIILGIAFLSK